MSLGNPQSFNRYSYVGNDPINLVDPTGLCTFTTTITNQDGTTETITDSGTLNSAGECMPYGTVQVYGWDDWTTGWGTWDLPQIQIHPIEVPGGIQIHPIEVPGGGGVGPGPSQPTCVESTSIVGAANDGLGGAGNGMRQQEGRFRLRKNGSLSPRHYQSDSARGNAYMTTHSMSRVGSAIAGASTAINIGQVGIDVGTNAYEEGGIGPRTVRAVGRALGSYFGSTGGAIVGGALAVEGGPVGVILGGLAGSAAGGAAGSHIANEVVHGIQDRNLPRGVRSCP